MVVLFDVRRLTGTVLKAEDVDKNRVKFYAEHHHLKCTSPAALLNMISLGPTDTSFHFSVYFHPNVRTDGWEEFKLIHANARQAYNNPLEASDSQAKEKKMGKQKKRKHFARRPFPDFPPEPKFWDEPVKGSQIFLWPPQFFDDWVQSVAKGNFLSLDPAPAAVAGPSHQGHTSPHPTSHHPSPVLPPPSSALAGPSNQGRPSPLPSSPHFSPVTLPPSPTLSYHSPSLAGSSGRENEGAQPLGSPPAGDEPTDNFSWDDFVIDIPDEELARMVL